MVDRRGLRTEPLEARRLLAVCLAESESNDLISSATAWQPTESPAARQLFQACGTGLTTSGDDDYWSFEALAGDRINLRATSTSGNLNNRLILYNQAGGQLASDTDAGPGNNARIENLSIASSGTYFARIDSQGGAGDYDLQLDVSRGDLQLETDLNNANDSIAGADPLTRLPQGNQSASALAGTISTASDQDIYYLGALGSGSTIALDLTFPSESELVAAVELLDSAGNSIADSDGILDDSFSSLAIEPSGDYFARVTMTDGATADTSGPQSRYILDALITDADSPVVVAVDGIPDDGSATGDLIYDFSVQFDEDLSPSSVVDPNAFSLIEAGADQSFGTSDDVTFSLQVEPAYSSGRDVNLVVTDGPLNQGQYQLTISGIVTDVAGNTLDGDGDGTGGDSLQTHFEVDFPGDIQFAFEGPSLLNNDQAGAVEIILSEDPAGSGLRNGFGLGSIDPAIYRDNWNDQDWWSFQAAAGDLVWVEVGTPDSPLDPYVELRNSAGNVLASDDSGGSDGDSLTSAHRIPADGTYYVRVGKNFWTTTPGRYLVRVSAATNMQVEEDRGYRNDNTNNAQVIQWQLAADNRSGRVTGSVMAPEGSNQDEDHFDLGYLNAGNTVELTVDLPSYSQLPALLQIIDSSGTVIADDDLAEDRFSGTIPSDGKYFARVSSAYWVHDQLRYQFTASSTWAAAEGAAIASGGHLATIPDHDTQTYVYGTFSGFGDLWIGLNDATSEGVFQWADGSPVDYTNWSASEPNGGDGSDGVFLNNSDGKWFDQSNGSSLRGLYTTTDSEGRLSAGPGFLAQYVLNVEVDDTAAPQVRSLTRLPGELQTSAVAP
ncbi:MAG: pre-peptidase C-terminal domain-containing protein, partial [Planctomycetota bacterium]